jgi:phosphohistidine phosphatase
VKLVLVRHGEAEPLRTTDAGRALTAHGRHQAEHTGKWLAPRLEGKGGLRLLASPYRRAQETAAILGDLLGVACRTVAAITPDEDVRRALAAIEAEASGTVLVVTHMPLVADIAGWIEHGVFAEGHRFRLAEARIYELETLGPAQATLHGHYSPDHH